MRPVLTPVHQDPAWPDPVSFTKPTFLSTTGLIQRMYEPSCVLDGKRDLSPQTTQRGKAAGMELTPELQRKVRRKHAGDSFSTTYLGEKEIANSKSGEAKDSNRSPNISD